LKVVFLSPAAQWGGAEAVLLDWMRSLRNGSPAISLHLLAGEDGPVLEACKASNISCEALPFPKALHAFGSGRGARHARSIWNTLTQPARRLLAWAGAGWACFRYRQALRRRLGQLQPDVIHSNGAKMHLLGALARPPSALLIWHLHEYVGTRPVMRALLRSVVSRCSMMIAISSSVATDARKALPHGPPVAMIHNTVDTAIFTPHGPALDLARLSGLSPPPIGTMRIGLVATFAHWKGQDVFLRAAASVAGNHRFYIIGGPIYATGGSQWSLDELRARAAALGVVDRVGFTGFVEDVPAAMRSLDVVVHASTEPEPFGLVILQAMACARPVIATAVGGAGELIAPEENALAVPAGDSAALARAIERLAAEPALRLRLAQAGRGNAERHFSRACLATKAVGLYEGLPTGCR
jgi:glycosyltransferase involved in cell wall biosynthesis